MSQSKNVDASGKSIIPSAYNLEHITLKNHIGEEKYIENIVTSFSITESLYSPTTILSISIKDSINFFETFELTGQESINVKINYKEHESGVEKTLNLTFYVTEYPTFGRPTSNSHVQVYKIKGISEQAYISAYKKISRSYEYSNTGDIIKNILERDCNLQENEIAIGGDIETKVKMNICYQSPFTVIESLRKITHDAESTPYYFYQSITSKYHLLSHSAIVSEPAYGTFTDTRLFGADSGSAKDYLDRKSRILECTSNLKLSKIEQAQKGAYASENNYLDYSTKTYTQHNYVYSDTVQANTLTKIPVVSDTFLLSDGQNTPVQTLEKFNTSHVEYVPLNTLAYKNTLAQTRDDGKLYNDIRVHDLHAYRALASTTTHDLKLFGDFQLNPGRVIELNFPKAVDPEVLKEFLEEDDTAVWDEALSGAYFIATTEHKFENGEYFVNIRVKRDSR